jgi:hypothetical protein
MNDNTTPSLGLQDPVVALRATVIGLCFAWPFERSNHEGCAFHQIRKRPMAERFAWVMQFKEETLQKLCEEHRRCLYAKEAEPAFPESNCGTRTRYA